MIADIYSVIIYWTGLFCTLVLAAIYPRLKIRNKVFNVLWIALMCLPLSIIAGMRSYVGTDYVNYVRIFNEIKELTFFECITHSYLDRGFAFIVRSLWLVVFDVKVMFFIFAFATLFIAFKTVSKYKSEISMVLFALFYYLIIYHHSLNVMRQCLAISLLLWSLSLMLERRYIRGLIVCLATMLIHDTAFIGIAFLIVIMIFDSKKQQSKLEGRKISLIRLIYYCAVFVSIFIIPVLLDIMMRIPFLSAYQHYGVDSVDIGLGRFAYFVLLLAPVVIMWKNVVSDRKVFSLFHVVLLYLPISFVGYYFDWASRMNLYTTIMVVLLALLVIRKEEKWWLRMAGYLWYIAVFAIPYVTDILVKNYGETFPYLV
ncbi:MAG: EpsG family protein [Ruminococcaceae bacterium]|nr:EpsG family protein [Oscillospiraceae bacterium]